MNQLGKCLLTLGLAALLAAPALAQPPGGGRGGRGPGGGNLLQNKGVQEELKLTKEQIDKAKTVSDEIRKKYEDDFKKMREMSQEERMELFKKVGDETNKGLSTVLNDDQQKRYKQIQLQQQSRMMGAGTLLTPDVEKGLKLTDDQKGKIKTIMEDTASAVKDLFEGGGQPGPEMFTKVQAINKEGMEKASATLTDDQKKAWKELLGAPFEVKFEGGPPRRPNPPADK
jgi:Spy/CpxP family protein refolding chaperone